MLLYQVKNTFDFAVIESIILVVFKCFQVYPNMTAAPMYMDVRWFMIVGINPDIVAMPAPVQNSNHRL